LFLTAAPSFFYDAAEGFSSQHPRRAENATMHPIAALFPLRPSP
jgi:hypothetical protein